MKSEIASAASDFICHQARALWLKLVFELGLFEMEKSPLSVMIYWLVKKIRIINKIRR